jgi:hypothetical protein
MFGDFVAPKSTVSARDILKMAIRDDPRIADPPELMAAVVWASNLGKERGWYVRPEFLLDVWEELRKAWDYGSEA